MTGKPTSHRLSGDGKWRSFPKIPRLLQYVSNGTFYRRTKVDGKIIRQSPETDAWAAAKLRLVDFLKPGKGGGGSNGAVDGEAGSLVLQAWLGPRRAGAYGPAP
jgi:hypothetical protein